jgi:hypothetical protein
MPTHQPGQVRLAREALHDTLSLSLCIYPLKIAHKGVALRQRSAATAVNEAKTGCRSRFLAEGLEPYQRPLQCIWIWQHPINW